MEGYTPIADISELTEGNMKTVLVNREEILLAMAGGKYYAVANRCTHLGGNLSQGKLEGKIITCPWHKSQFDISDGHVIRWTNRKGLIASLIKIVKPPKPLETFKIVIEDTTIMVVISK